MQTRQLGRSGISITALGLGTNYVGGHNLYTNVDEDEGVRFVQYAIDNGVTSIDTADVYGAGRSEELVGKAIKGRRDKIMLATKGSILFGDNGPGVNNDCRRRSSGWMSTMSTCTTFTVTTAQHRSKTPSAS
jgi:aryl-alcohol dehydrogenase-like predicted oxidoreductase